MHASSLQSVLDNYEVLLGVWNEALSLQLDVESKDYWSQHSDAHI